MRQSIPRHFVFTTASLLGAALWAGWASAVDNTWQSNASADWNTAANWVNGIPDTTTERAVFDGTGSQNSVTFGAAVGGGSGFNGILVKSTQTSALDISNSGAGVLNFRLASSSGITIESGAGAFSLGTSGANIQLVPNTASLFTFQNDSANTATLGNRITSTTGGGASAFRMLFTGSGNWQVNAALNPSGGGGTPFLTKDGTGTTTLTGTNTYTGATTVTAGALLVGNGTTVGALSGSSAIGVAGGATMQFSHSNAQTIANAVSGAGTLAFVGTNAPSNSQSDYVLTGNNSGLTGTLVADSARVRIDNANDTGSATLVIRNNGQFANFGAPATFSNNITVDAGSAGWWEAGGNLGNIRMDQATTLSGNITANGTLLLGSAGTVTNNLTGVISGAGGVSLATYSAAGVTAFVLGGSASNTYTGATTLQATGAVKSLNLAKTGGAVAIAAGNVVNFAAGSQSNLRMGDTTTVGAGRNAFDNQFGAGVTLHWLATSGNWGRFDLQGTNQTVAGLNAGTVSTQAGAVIQNQNANNFDPGQDATLTLNGSGTYVYNGYMRDQDNSGTTRKLNLVKNGSGIQTLAGGAIIYTGTTTINAGEIQLASANVGRGDWTINSGGILRGMATDSIDYIRSVTVNAGGKIIQSGGSYQQFYNGGAGGTVLILNGGSVEATVAGHANYGNFLLRGNMLVGGTQKNTISADFRMGDNADRTFTVNSTGDASGIDLDITGKFSHFEGVTWGYMTKEGGGTMRFTATSTNGVGRLTLNAGKVLMVDTAATSIGWGNGGVTNNAEFEVQVNGADRTYASQLSGTGSFTKSGAGTLHFNGGGQVIAQSNFYITGGKLQNNNNSVNWSTNTGDMDISAGATLDLYADGVRVGGLNGAGTVTNGYGNNGSAEILTVGAGDKSGSFAGVITQTGAGAVSGSGVGQGALALTKIGTGTQILAGTNTYRGVTTLSGGTLQIGDGGTTGTLGLGTVTNNAALAFNRSDAHSVSNVISGSGVVNQIGSGTTTLTGANAYTGATTVSAGALNIRHATALGTVAGGTSVTSGAALQIQNNITVGAEALTLNGTGVANDGALRNISGTNAMSGAITLGSDARINSDAGTLTLSGNIGGVGRDLTVGGAGNTTLSGVIGTTTGGFTKGGTGTVVLSGANTYAGDTQVNAGTLQLDFAAGGTSDIVSAVSALSLGGGTLNVKGGAGEANTQTFNGLSGSGTLSITQNGATSVNATLGAIGTGGAIDFSGGTTTVVAGAAVLGNANFQTTSATTNNNGTDLFGAHLWNGSDWASTAANGGNNYVVKWQGTYVETYNGTDSGTVALPTGLPGSNVRINESTGSYTNNTLAASETINSLLMAATGHAATLDMGANTLTLGNGAGATGAAGISATGQSLTFGTAVDQGVLTAGTSGASLLSLNNANSAGATLTVNSVIADNSGGGAVSVETSGNTVFTGANTHTGITAVNSGTLNIRSDTALGAVAGGTSVATGATLELNGGLSIGAEDLTLSGSGLANRGALRNLGTNTYGGAVGSPGTELEFAL